MQRKRKIKIGQNWIVWSPMSDKNQYFQIVAQISDGGWMYNNGRANSSFFIAVGYRNNCLKTVIFDEYGDEVNGNRFSLCKRSMSKVSWIRKE